MMHFQKAIIVFDDDEWEDGPNKMPHSDVEIHENGWVSAETVKEDSSEKTRAYYSPEKAVAVFPKSL